MYTDIVNSKDYESMTKSVEIARAEAYNDYNTSIEESKLLTWPRPVMDFKNEEDWREAMNMTSRSKLEDDLSKIQHAQKYKEFVFATTVEDKSIKRASFFESEWGKRAVYVFFFDSMWNEIRPKGKIDFMWNSHTKAERYIWEEAYLQMYKNR